MNSIEQDASIADLAKAVSLLAKNDEDVVKAIDILRKEVMYLSRRLADLEQKRTKEAFGVSQ